MARLGFVVSAVRNSLSGEKAAYAARVRHMGVIRGEDLYNELAQHMAVNKTLAENLVNGLCGFIEDRLQHGYKLDFGDFKVGLTIRGGFDAINDKFNPDRNEMCVSFSAGTRLKNAVSKMCPMNLTDANYPVIKSVCGMKKDSKLSVIVCHETCGANGRFPAVAFTGQDDGVWLESADGVRIATAKVLSNKETRIDFVFESDIPGGRYKLVIGFREEGEASVSMCDIPVLVQTCSI